MTLLAKGGALEWWCQLDAIEARRQRQVDEGIDPPPYVDEGDGAVRLLSRMTITWKEFEDALHARFDLINPTETARDPLAGFKQMTSVQEYTRRFLTICAKIDDLTTSEQKHCYYERRTFKSMGCATAPWRTWQSPRSVLNLLSRATTTMATSKEVVANNRFGAAVATIPTTRRHIVATATTSVDKATTRHLKEVLQWRSVDAVSRDNGGQHGQGGKGGRPSGAFKGMCYKSMQAGHR